MSARAEGAWMFWVLIAVGQHEAVPRMAGVARSRAYWACCELWGTLAADVRYVPQPGPPKC